MFDLTGTLAYGEKDIQISRVKRLDSTNSVVIRLEILNFDPPIQATFY